MALNPVYIGRRIRKVRKRFRLSQEAFAERIDSSTRTVCNIETGAVVPQTATLYAISVAFDVSVDGLLGISDDAASIHSAK